MPEIADLHIDVPGLELTKSGHAAVVDYENMNVEGIYTLGGVTGRAELTPGMGVFSARHGTCD